MRPQGPKCRGIDAKLLNADQTVFFPGGSFFLNFRRLLTIMLSPRISKDLLILSLDTEKAFDQVEWTYLYVVMF